MKLISILFFVFISFTIAQQYDYGGDDGGWNNQDYDNYGTGGGGQDDNLLRNYAAKQEGKNNAVGGYGYGWGKLLLAGVGGYITGATIHAGRAKKKSAPKLRFKLKQRVECNMGGTAWMKGTIIKLWSQPTKGQWFPYAIQLDDGQQTMAPADNDLTIRAA